MLSRTAHLPSECTTLRVATCLGLTLRDVTTRKPCPGQGSQKLLKNLLGLVNFEKRTGFH